MATSLRAELQGLVKVAGSDKTKELREPETSLVAPETTKPEKIPETGWGLAAYAINKLTKVLITAIRGLLDRWVLIGVTFIVVAGVVVYSALTDNTPDKLIELVKLVIDFVGTTFWSVGGWVTAGTLVVVGGGVIVRQHRRIQEQGDLLAKLKDNDDPERLSSRRPNQLQEYASMEQAKLLDKYNIVPAPNVPKTENEDQ